MGYMTLKTNTAMKRFAITILFCIAYNACYTQDVIYKRDGTTIEAKVIEIDNHVVKYKKFGQQDGPIRNISKDQLNKIVYKDGSTDDYSGEESKNLSTANDSTTYTKTSTINDLDYQIQKAKSLKKVGTALSIPAALLLMAGGGMFVFSYSAGNGNETSAQNLRTIGIVCFSASVPFIISSTVVYSIGRSNLYELEKRRKAEVGLLLAPCPTLNGSGWSCIQVPSIGFSIKF